MSEKEQTLSIIKPDAVERNLEKEIKTIFEDSGLKIINSKKFIYQKKKLQIFIKFIKQNLFMIDYVHIYHSGPIIAMILEGSNAIKKKRVDGRNGST